MDKKIPLKAIPAGARKEESEWRKAERELRKMEALVRQKRRENKRFKPLEIPSWLQRFHKRKWAQIIGSGIISGLLEKCCDAGCDECFNIGWVKKKPGPIINMEPPLYTTGEFGMLRGVSYKTISRKCDEGLITCFRLPLSRQRYVIDES